MTQETLAAFQRLNDILDTLRRECPWDKVQTLASLRYLTIEEVYELSEAVLKVETTGDDKANSELKKELGDLFMHLLFYSKIAEDEHRFTTADVLNAICDKLIDRHPFIYHKEQYDGESWEQIKMHEGRKSVLEGVPAGLPPLVKAVRLQEKASGIGYNDIADPSPLNDEMDEQQFGDLLFQLVHWAHNRGINADDALSKANLRFQEEVRNYENQTRQTKESSD
ncbi:MAG: nucleoside triphosphate pyrophosphohydrolase [Bacteroidales bacterium]|nr:nucleoside triphosphate pyrophosphohydrolase [Bacteroidales bacterium]